MVNVESQNVSWRKNKKRPKSKRYCISCTGAHIAELIDEMVIHGYQEACSVVEPQLRGRVQYRGHLCLVARHGQGEKKRRGGGGGER